MAIFTPEHVTCTNCGVREELGQNEACRAAQGEQVRTECRFCIKLGERSLVRIVRRSARHGS